MNAVKLKNEDLVRTVMDIERANGASEDEVRHGVRELVLSINGYRKLLGPSLLTVMECLPMFSQALAIELGVKTKNLGMLGKQLRKLGSKDKITKEVVFDTMRKLAA